MSKAKILDELAHLSPEDLVGVGAWLDRMMPDATFVTADKAGSVKAGLRTPRLANPAQSADFAKQVTELPADAALRS